MKKLLLILGITITNFSFSQQTKNVLFIGNSYTGVNNLPQLTKDLSLSAGDNLIIDSHTPGGQTFQGHFGDATVHSKIALGNWDFVVLQEQSQRPSFPDSQVEVEVFPFAEKLDSLIRSSNPCAETIFYMTWGRKNGDAGNCASWPPVCTYSGMDSLLYLRYMQMADDNQAIVSPVGKLWHYLRMNHPEIELYNADESHPSLAGSYAAACSFYTTIFRKNPSLITNDYGLNANDALAIRQAAELIVFDSLMNWHIGEYDLRADFSFNYLGNGAVQFTNESISGTSYSWSFGDNTFSSDPNPTHTFTSNESFTVQLITSNDCGLSDTTMNIVNPQGASLFENENPTIKIYPNPVTSFLSIESAKNITLSVLDVNWRTIDGISINSLNQIDLSSLSNGVYLLKIITENQEIEYFQIIKQ